MVRATVGIALGAGGAKGLAHIGVLKALTENHITVDVVAGSSMGSVIGSFYATGMQPSFMEKLACTLRFRHWLDLTVPRVGLVAGEKIRQMVTLLTRNLQVGESDLPLAIVATELMSRTSVIFDSGPIGDAVRASIAIPGVFVPFVTEQGVYVDGGVMNKVPVNAAKALGADVVIGVDVTVNQRITPPETMLDVIWLSLDAMQNPVMQQEAPVADIAIEPDLSDIGTSHFGKAEEAIRVGYAAALAQIDNIKQCIADATHRLT